MFDFGGQSETNLHVGSLTLIAGFLALVPKPGVWRTCYETEAVLPYNAQMLSLLCHKNVEVPNFQTRGVESQLHVLVAVAIWQS